jgi:hydroxyacylglutathione hydrolase
MSQLKIAILPVTPLAQNCSIVWCEATKKAAAVDPGGDLQQVVAAIDEQHLTLEKVLLTHGHIDHAGGAAELAEMRGVPVEGPHRDDQFLLDGLPESGRQFGFQGVRPVTPDRWLEDGDTVTVGELSFDVYHCPGHSPGHVIFFHGPSRLAIVGDVLFQGSIGRTDLPGGDHDALITSVKTKLWPLGEDVAFVPGHGPMSTFSEERRSNPFVRD